MHVYLKGRINHQIYQTQWRVSLYVATPPAIVAIDLHPIVHLSLAHGSGCGSRCTTHLSESACASQDALRPAILKERTNVDCSHHGPFLSFRFFYAEMLKKAQEGGGEVVKLNTAVKRSLGRPGSTMIGMRNEGTKGLTHCTNP